MQVFYTAKPCVSILNADHVARFDVPRLQAFSPLTGILLDMVFPERFQRTTFDILLIQLQPSILEPLASYFPYLEDKSAVSIRRHG